MISPCRMFARLRRVSVLAVCGETGEVTLTSHFSLPFQVRRRLSIVHRAMCGEFSDDLI